MSLKQVLFASGAAIWLVAPVSEVSAQYRYTDRPTQDRQRQDRQVQPVRSPKVDAVAAKKPVPVVSQPSPAAKAVEVPKPVEVSRPVEKPAPVPLTDEQLAAKAAVDELLARDPALVAAKEIPDPALYRAAVAKHNAEEARRAALIARQEAESARRKDLDEKNKVRDEAKVAALKNKPDTAPKNAKPKVDTARARPMATMPPRNGLSQGRSL